MQCTEQNKTYGHLYISLISLFYVLALCLSLPLTFHPHPPDTQLFQPPPFFTYFFIPLISFVLFFLFVCFSHRHLTVRFNIKAKC